MGNTEALDFASLPPIFIITAGLPAEDLHQAEDAVYEHAGQLSYQPKEARIFLGRVSQKRRAAFELRSRGVWTEESTIAREPVRKRRRLNHIEETRSISGSETESEYEDGSSSLTFSPGSLSSLEDHVIVLKLDWLHKSINAGHFLPFQPYQVYCGRIVDKPEVESIVTTSQTQTITLIKATPDTPGAHIQSSSHTWNEHGSSITSILDSNLPTMKFSPRRFRDQHSARGTTSSTTLTALHVPSHPRLHRTTTSEHDFVAEKLPPQPSWLTARPPLPTFSCLRSTYANPPNTPFLKHLYKIKEARILTLDEIGVRAYSTAIASLSAYPHPITNPAEIIRLPGCSEKIATLWWEWYNSSPSNPDQRTLSITTALDLDEDLTHLRLFYNIWGVGAETARKFYFQHGWKDLDDLVEYGWHTTLNRVQQIGVKYHAEFQQTIPRLEVENIANTILHHARLVAQIPKSHWSNATNNHTGNWTKPDDGHGDSTWDPDDITIIIVGGYRRGKPESGDVDVILTHRNPEITQDLIIPLVRSLESSNHITHTLTLHTTTSDRNQETLPLKPSHNQTRSGFDTLDKALCVWQDPVFHPSPSSSPTTSANEKKKNPNIHRRVDIIISPYHTIGAAVLGWSGATTFERDIRVWCQREKGWKFDSSGVRDRRTGAVLDLESPSETKPKAEEKTAVRKQEKEEEGDVDDGDGWQDRERRLMQNLGIGWRPACERWTG